jgi:plasmid stability protein
MKTTMVQVRNVPDELHRRLKSRAAAEGLTISDFVLREIRKAVERPTRQELLERLATGPRTRLRRNPADVIRADRDSR